VFTNKNYLFYNLNSLPPPLSLFNILIILVLYLCVYLLDYRAISPYELKSCITNNKIT